MGICLEGVEEDGGTCLEGRWMIGMEKDWLHRFTVYRVTTFGRTCIDIALDMREPWRLDRHSEIDLSCPLG